MWLKFVFAFAYVFILVTLSRIVDVAFKSGLTLLFQHASSAVKYDASNMTTKQLQSVLNRRGIPYDHLIEKREYKQLILASGPLEQDEVDDALTADNSDVSEDPASLSPIKSRITSRGHFSEMVEDTKDSAWLILVVPFISSTATAFTPSSSEWWATINKLSTFGIRMAVFDCFDDISFCSSRNWRSPRFILSLPKNHHKAKSDVILKQYLLSDRVVPSSIFRWVHSELASRVTVIKNARGLKRHRLIESTQGALKINAQNSKGVTNVIYVCDLMTPPLSISGLAVKFNGVANIFMINSKLAQQIAEQTPGLSVSSMLVTLANGSFYTCHSCKTFARMNTILKTLLPDMNDIFSLSLYLINISLVIHFFWLKCSKVWAHITFWLMELVKLNSLLLLFWLAIVAVNRFSYFQRIVEPFILGTQIVSSSCWGEAFRQHFNSFTNLPFIVASVVSCGCFFAWLRRYKLSSDSGYDDDQLFRESTPLSLGVYDYNLSRTHSVADSPSESIGAFIDYPSESIAALVERLAVPNIWLRAEFWSNDYIAHLPLWLHPGTASSENSSSDLDVNTHDSVDSNAAIANTCSNCTSTSHASCLASQQTDASNSPVESSSTSSTASKANHSTLQRESTDQAPSGLNDACRRSKDRKNSDGKLIKQRQPASHVPPEFDAGSRCAICLETYVKNETICGLPCGHAFHDDCIMPWLFGENHICPLCRWPTYKKRVTH